jgi:hypothetical protein
MTGAPVWSAWASSTITRRSARSSPIKGPASSVSPGLTPRFPPSRTRPAPGRPLPFLGGHRSPAVLECLDEHGTPSGGIVQGHLHGVLDEPRDAVGLATGHQSADRLHGFHRQRHRDLHRSCQTDHHTVETVFSSSQERRAGPGGVRPGIAERAHDGHARRFVTPAGTRWFRRFARSRVGQAGSWLDGRVQVPPRTLRLARDPEPVFEAQHFGPSMHSTRRRWFVLAH